MSSFYVDRHLDLIKELYMFQVGATKSSEAAVDAVVVETAEVEPGVVRFTATPKAFKTPTALRSARKSRRR